MGVKHTIYKIILTVGLAASGFYGGGLLKDVVHEQELAESGLEKKLNFGSDESRAKVRTEITAINDSYAKGSMTDIYFRGVGGLIGGFTCLPFFIKNPKPNNTADKDSNRDHENISRTQMSHMGSMR